MKEKEIRTLENTSELGRVVADHAHCTPQNEPDCFGPGLVRWRNMGTRKNLWSLHQDLLASPSKFHLAKGCSALDWNSFLWRGTRLWLDKIHFPLMNHCMNVLMGIPLHMDIHLLSCLTTGLNKDFSFFLQLLKQERTLHWKQAFSQSPPSTSLCSRASETHLHWHARCHLSVAVWLLQAQLLRVVETRVATLEVPSFAVPLLLQQ